MGKPTWASWDSSWIRSDRSVFRRCRGCPIFGNSTFGSMSAIIPDGLGSISCLWIATEPSLSGLPKHSSACRIDMLWRAGLFRGVGIKMVRGDWMRGGGMVRRMGGVLIRGSSRSTAEKLPRINSAGSTGDGFSSDCGAVRRSRRGRGGGGARVRRHPAPRMSVVMVSGPVAEPVRGRAGG